jgi:hypothetical protein
MTEHISNPITRLVDSLAKDLFSMSREEAWEKKICIKCKRPASFYSQAGIKEYKKTALCEKCFDEITGGGE